MIYSRNFHLDSAVLQFKKRCYRIRNKYLGTRVLSPELYLLIYTGSGY
jgi:hypothetical protein